MGPPYMLKKTTFPAEFCDDATLYIYILKRIIFKHKKIGKIIYRFKMAAKLLIFTSRRFDFGENFKKYVLKGIFQ